MKRTIRSGDRVRLRAPSPILALRSSRGRVVGPDRIVGYWVVELDAPADYVDADGEAVCVRRIREHPENLIVLEQPPMTPRRAPTGAAQAFSAGQQRPPAPKTTTDTGSPLERHLLASIRAHGLPEPEQELRFHETRRWRLDFAWPAVKLAVEVEGGIYRGGGHTHVKDLKRDMEKSNALTLDGWRLLRFHGDQVKSGEAVAVIAQALGVEVLR